MSVLAEFENPLEVNEDAAVRALYRAHLDAWNRRRADELADLYVEEGNVVGFDGSQINGRLDIESTIRTIFDNHQTAAYVGKVREIRFLGPDVALLRAAAGMIHEGEADIDPKLNAIHSLLAVRRNGDWRVSLFQNTPAQFHGRPDLTEALTEELHAALAEERG